MSTDHFILSLLFHGVLIATVVQLYPTCRTTHVSLSHFGVSLHAPRYQEETMRLSSHPAIPPQPPSSRTQSVEPLGLVAGLLEARGLPEGMDPATPPAPARRLVTVGPAGKALVRHGLGVSHPPRSLVPPFCQT